MVTAATVMPAEEPPDAAAAITTIASMLQRLYSKVTLHYIFQGNLDCNRCWYRCSTFAVAVSCTDSHLQVSRRVMRMI
jgi:hypothetical protein